MLVAPITATALKAAPDEFSGLAAGVNTTVSRLGGLIATPVLGVVITLSFAAATSHHGVDPFSKHLTPDQRDATITAFRAAIAASVALCLLGSIVAYAWLPGAPPPHREQEPVVTPA
jgi:Na+/melibiose symporter-like transporter